MCKQVIFFVFFLKLGSTRLIKICFTDVQKMLCLFIVVVADFVMIAAGF